MTADAAIGWFADLRITDRPTVGGKGASLGELTFAGSKGGRVLSERSLTITSTTTVGDLISFMEQSFGIVKTASETSFPAANYGGDIAGSRLQFTSNMGIENALSVDLSAFQLTPTGGTATSVLLPFSSSQTGTVDGEGSTANFVVYDSLGTPVGVPRRLRALYFTRATAPWGEGPLYHHFGVYAYRRTALERFVSLAPSPLEIRERLEQLRALEDGMRIDVTLVDTIPVEVNTPDDLDLARRLFAG